MVAAHLDCVYYRTLHLQSDLSFSHSPTRSFLHSCLPLAGLSLPVEPSWALHLHIGIVSRNRRETGESKRGFVGLFAQGGERREET